MRKFFFNILPIFATIFLVLLFFAIPLSAGKIPMPADSLLGLYHPWRDSELGGYNPGRFPVKNPLITDPVLQTFPWRYLTIENLKKGYLPLWNPYSFSGQPLLANIQSAAFQITNLLFFAIPAKIAWAGQVIIPIILTAVFMFFLLKSFRLSAISSIFGAFAFSFSGFFVSWMTWGTITATAMWLPLIILSMNKLFAKLSPKWFLILTFAYSQSLLSGHLQTSFYVLLASLLYLIYIFFKSRTRTPLVYSLLSLFLGILIASVQLLPSFEFINLSSRNIDQNYFQGREDWFLPLQNLIQLLIPDYFGNPATYNYWGVWNYAEFVSFIGIVPLFFAVVALIKRKVPSFFLILLIMSILFALENHLSKIPYILNFPYISSIQPSRIIFLFNFSLAILAAFGLEHFRKTNSKKEFFASALLLASIIFTLAIYTQINKENFPQVDDIDTVKVALKNLILPLGVSLSIIVILLTSFLKVNKRILTFTLFAIALAELFRFGYKFTPFSKLEWIFPQTQSLTFLQNQPKPFRVMTTDRRILHPNSSSVYQLESIDGYDPLYLKSYSQFVSVLQSGSPQAKISSFNRIVTPQKLDSPLINLLNVKYVLSFDEISNQNFAKVFEEGITKIYLNKNFIPRAFLAAEVIKVDTPQEEFEKLLNSKTDLTKTAISQEFDFTGREVNGKVSFRYYGDQSIGLDVEADHEVPLVLTNIDYPGWISFIDNQKADIKKVNFMFQSVLVPAGKHFVEFKYQPKSFYNGLYLSAMGTFLSITCALYLWRTKYR